jgi:hypothetical protein
MLTDGTSGLGRVPHLGVTSGLAGVRGLERAGFATQSDGRMLLTVSCPGGLREPAERWIGPLLARWPSNLPRARVQLASGSAIAFDPLPAELADRPTGPLVAIVPADQNEAEVEGLVAHARRTARPTIFLGEAMTPALLRAEDEGFLVESWEADPGVVVGMLSVLLRRQPLVQRLARESEAKEDLRAGGPSVLGADDLTLASILQRPSRSVRLPRTPGLESVLISRPSGPVANTLVDVTCLDESLIRFYALHTAARGVTAAMATMLASRTLSLGHAGSRTVELFHPSEALGRLNDVLADRSVGPTARQMGVVYGVLDAATGELTIAGGGFAGPMIFTPDGVEHVHLPMTPLGMEPRTHFSERTWVMHAGDFLALAGKPLIGNGEGEAALARSVRAGQAARSVFQAGEALEHAIDRSDRLRTGAAGEDLAALLIGFRLASPRSLRAAG